MLIIHSRPYQPEGRGKIERFFRTLREQFLGNLDPKHPLSADELNERLWLWLESVYHRADHSALGTTPLLRWQRDIEHVRQLLARYRSLPSLPASPRPSGAPRLDFPAAQPAL